MDPNETLRKILNIASGIIRAEETEDIQVPDHGIALELAEAVQDLDRWMRSGGFKPTAWAGRSCPACAPRKGK